MEHIKKVRDLYEQTIMLISQSEDEWKKFLECMGRLYQLNFFNVCMVYAQRPDATILAGIKEWEELGFSVVYGSKGIAIFPSKIFGENVSHVFDVADTRGIGVSPWNWMVNGTNRRFLARRLFPDIYEKEKKFKNALNIFTRTFVWSMIKEEDGIVKNLERLQSLTGTRTSIEGMEITRFIVDSTLYTVGSRCGIRDGEFDFSFISHCRNEEILYRIGRLASHLSGRILFEISKVMKNIDLERSAYYGRDYRDSLQGNRRLSISCIGDSNERSGSDGGSGKIRQDGSKRASRERTGTVRDDVIVGNVAAQNEGSAGTGRNAARKNSGRLGRSLGEEGRRESLQHDGNDKPADSGRDGGRGGCNKGSYPSNDITHARETDRGKQNDLKQEEGTAFAVPSSLEIPLSGEITEKIKRHILCEITGEEWKRQIHLFFANNQDLEDRKECLVEIYGDWKIIKESEDMYLSCDGDGDGFSLFWTESDSKWEGYWKWDDVCESIDKYIRDRQYLILESISEQAMEGETCLEDSGNQIGYMEESLDLSKEIKGKILDVAEEFFRQKNGIDILKKMLCQIYTTNQLKEEKCSFLRKVLTENGEIPQSYHMVHLGEDTYEVFICEENVRISQADEREKAFSNLQFDWEEFGDLTARLVEENRILYSENLETMRQQQKMLQMFPWFVSLQNAYVTLNGMNELGLPEERETFAEAENPYHIKIRKEAVYEFIKNSTVVVPYQALIWDFFHLDVTKRAKSEFIQCLLTEANQCLACAFPANEIPVNARIEDNLVRIRYMDQEGNEYEQLLSYMEIADEIQEAIDRESFLTPEEYELGKMERYVFCGERAIELFEEFANRICVEPPKRIRNDSFQEGDVSVEQRFVGEPTGEPAEFYYNEGWRLPEGGSKTRYQCNVNAIRTLRLLEHEGRIATAREQEILAGYVGWGGLSNVFNSRNTAWKKEYKELKELLNEKEYNQARQSVTTSFYTPPEIIQGIYHALKQFGFEQGRILEPALGIGNFFHGLPEEMRKSELYGVEIDSISGRIAQYLHPTANIQIKGFEATDFGDNSFDVVIGNVPFGNFKVYDPRYKKKKLKIHDYFITKSLDILRPGGILAVVTSKGTLDKKDSSMRKELAEQAQLLGAIRLPGKSFSKNANTDVTSDILFFRKKPEKVIEETIWTYTGLTEERVPVNEYFLEHPEMLLGKMVFQGVFGKESQYTALVNNDPEFDLSEKLLCAVEELPKNIYRKGKIEEEQEVRERIEAVPSVPDFTYTVYHDEIYYREGNYMYRFQGKEIVKRRIRGMHKIRILVREIMEMQTKNCSDEALHEAQRHLNNLYDVFVETHGYFSDRMNKTAFRQDNDYPLLASLEVVDEDKNVHKADMFYKRTIQPRNIITKVENAYEALQISLSEHNRVHIPFMLSLYPGSHKEMVEELADRIYLNPLKADRQNPNKGWETAEEYLSGDVRQKLRLARIYAQTEPGYTRNVEALERVQPKELTATDISVKLGTTWIDTEDYEQFLYEVLQTPSIYRRGETAAGTAVTVEQMEMDMSYHISNKHWVSGSVIAKQTFGTNRMDAYTLAEEIMNGKMIVVRDRIEEGEKVRYEINKKETMIARDKAEQLKEEFQNWIFKDPVRRKKYVGFYNQNFNCIRLREYEGAYLELPGLSPLIQLRPYQKNAVARILSSGGNTLLAHAVGAGKSIEMVCACMEMRRLGIATKPMITVPNHLTYQMGAEFLRTYPNANILIAKKEDFKKENRRRLMARIATGDYDCVIVGHTQFQRIPISEERQKAMIEKQIEQLITAIAKANEEEGKAWTVKKMETKKQQLQDKIESMNNEEIKDHVVTFEELGVNAIFVDEAHLFKNVEIFTKMSNIAGINASGSQRAMDMRMKAQYINEINHGTGVVLATGTPISNSMSELYVMQLFLQEERLRMKGIHNFDAWASSFGEVTTALELAPEGTGYRMRTRFNKFVNLPELMMMFRETADIILPEMLDIPKPKLKGGKYIIVESEASEYVRSCMEKMVERAEAIRNGVVDPSRDNMLKITGEARLLGTDVRLLDVNAPIDEDSKLYKAARNIYKEYVDSMDDKGTQIVFSDIGTPGNGKVFTVYDFLKEKLIEMGVPEEEICFIHNAKTDEQRDVMFADMRSGRKRIIIGSTDKLGTGTNIQDRIVAMHHIDCPWKPSAIEQREGRGLRHGNRNKEVSIYRYVTKNSFDAYLWGIVETKQRFISQVMTSKELARNCEDVDETILNFAEIKAVASGNPLILEKMEVDNEVTRLRVLKSAYEGKRYVLQDAITFQYPQRILSRERELDSLKKDICLRDEKMAENILFEISIKGRYFSEYGEAGEFLRAVVEQSPNKEESGIGTYKGFEIDFEKVYEGMILYLRGSGRYKVEMKKSDSGNMVRLENTIKALDSIAEEVRQKIENYHVEIRNAKIEYEKEFPYEELLREKLKRQTEINMQLEIKEDTNIIEIQEETEKIPQIEAAAR